jgi:hypothetical protein
MPTRKSVLWRFGKKYLELMTQCCQFCMLRSTLLD